MLNAEAEWKQFTLEGNRLFNLGEFSRSVHLYEQARELATSGFDEWLNIDDAVAAVVVSYLNLSEAQARCGQLQQASAALCRLHGGLQEARTSRHLPAALRDAALCHLKESLAALVRFQATYGPQPDVARWLGACRCAACDDRAAETAAALHDPRPDATPSGTSFWGQFDAGQPPRTLH